MASSQEITLPQTKIEVKSTDYGTGFDLAIIGAGPAGLTACLYSLRAGLATVLFEEAILGGRVNSTYQIENYPGFPEGIRGEELVKLMKEQVVNLGPEIIFAGVVRTVLEGQKKLIFLPDGKSIAARAVIISSGSTPKKLNVPGEEEFLGRGLSYCAICDGPLYKEKKVAVIGGGDAALEEALFLARYAASVTVIHRRGELRASKILVRAAFENNKIHFIWDSEVKGFRGGQRLEELVIFNSKENKEFSAPFDGAFIYIGSQPATDFISEPIKCDPAGFIETDDLMQTSLAGVFAAGDVRKKNLRQIVTATADGAIAAISAYHYLKE